MPEHTERPTQSITASLVVKDAARAIDFYKKAFGAKELMRMAGPGDKGIMHAEVVIGNSSIMLSDEFPGMPTSSPEALGSTTASLYLYVDDVDAVFTRAIEAGGKEEMAVQDMFWGDRMGSLIDPSGHHWSLATHTEDVSEEEMNKRAKEFFAKMEACREAETRTSI